MRDPYTSGHQQRVSDLARTIATDMGLSKEKIEAIRVAGTIHDLGKISIPNDILTNPSCLTNDEFGIIKTHSQVGYDVLKAVDLPGSVDQIVLQHHERMDGSGYPSGLKGKDILIEARILAVADVVEAMASHRPYRPAPGIDSALREISKNKGILYDPEVVDTCLKLFTEKGFSFQSQEELL
jgi:HD-GYP domain-containing protein (c-di-GMP phosphodiesterase class II)